MHPGREELFRFMSSRRFVAGRKELLNAGFSRTRIESWLHTGRLIPQFRGVYSYGRGIESREAAWRAGLILAGPGSILTGRSALELWGAVRLKPKIPFLIQTATSADRAGTHDGLAPPVSNTSVRVVRRSFGKEDFRRKDHLSLASPAFALIEFAPSVSDLDLKFAFLELCRLRLFKSGDVEYGFSRAVRRRGATKVKPLFTMWIPELERIRSVLEGLFLLAWIRNGWEAPEVNVKVFGREVDMFWRRERLALELDGDAFHTDPISKQRDMEKNRFLKSKGIQVIRVTWKEFMADPDGVVARIVVELSRRI